MRCPKCGKKIGSDTQKCPVCNNLLNKVSNTVHIWPAIVFKPAEPGTRCPKCGKILPQGALSCPVCNNAADISVVSNVQVYNSKAQTVSNYGRCPKCGKKTEASASSCTTCDQVFTYSQPKRQSTKSFCKDCGNQFENGECIYCNNKQTKPTYKSTAKSSRIIIIIPLGIAAAAIAAVFGPNFVKNKNASSMEKTSIDTSINIESHETVNDKLTATISTDGFESMDISKRKQYVEETVDDLSAGNYIFDVRYNDKACMYEFTYNDGVKGGILLEPFSDELCGIEKHYAEKDDNGKVTNITNKVEFDSSDYTYNKTPKIKIMYGLGNDEMYSNIEKRTSVWESEGIDVDTDDFCTVEDFTYGLIGYDYIQIEEHGSMYDDDPVICLEEKVTEENLIRYSSDLKKENIVEVKVVGKDPNESYYWIKPSFFSTHYKNSELFGSIVFIGSCHGYENDRLVKAFKNAGADTVIGYTQSVYMWYNYSVQDAFVYALMCGDTASSALKYATDIWGSNDEEWYHTNYNKSYSKDNIAEPRMLGNTEKKLVDIRATKTTSKAKDSKPEEIVPELVEAIVSKSVNEPNWIDSFEMFESYKEKYGFEQNEMWFQDVSGDGEPELIIGGYGINLYQPEIHIFEIMNENDFIASGEDLYTLWTSRRNYGHNAFTLQAFRDSDGSLVFADGRLYEYTGSFDPNGSGAYELSEYRFNSNVTSRDILYFNYNNLNGSDEFTSFLINGKDVNAFDIVNEYKDYFSNKTPLKANIKTVGLSKYKKMSKAEKTAALTESYNAFYYTEDTSVTLPLKEMIDKIDNSLSASHSSSKESKKSETPSPPEPTSENDIFSAYTKKLTELSYRDPHGCYYFCDIDKDGYEEMIYRSDENQYPYTANVFEYKNGSVAQIDDIPCSLGVRSGLYYSSLYNGLVVNSISPESPSDYPSGNAIHLLQVTKSGNRLDIISKADVDAGEFNEENYGLENISWSSFS